MTLKMKKIPRSEFECEPIFDDFEGDTIFVVSMPVHKWHPRRFDFYRWFRQQEYRYNKHWGTWLGEFDGENVFHNTSYHKIWFATEEIAMWFLLRWGSL